MNIKILCTGNNTIGTIVRAERTSESVKTVSAGRLGFKGARRGSAHAAEMVGREIGRILRGVTEQNRTQTTLEDKVTTSSKETTNRPLKVNAPIGVSYSGHNLTISSVVRGLRASGVKIDWFEDVTPVPHNGCRRRTARRI